MMPIVFHEEAHAEMIGAAEWYNRQQPNVGEGFLDEIDIALERIAATPEAFGLFSRQGSISPFAPVSLCRTLLSKD